MLISKVATSSTTGKLLITTQILSNISCSKDNQTMKFGKVIEYNMIIIFLKNSQIVVEKLVPDSVLKY